MTDCNQLSGRLRDLCRGYDDDGNPVSTPEKRAKWQQYFHGDTRISRTDAPGNLLTLKTEERRARIEEARKRTERLIGWLTFFRLPGDTGIGDTAHRLNMRSCKSPDAHAQLKRLLTMCSCSRSDAVAKLNAEHSYPAHTRSIGGS